MGSGEFDDFQREMQGVKKMQPSNQVAVKKPKQSALNVDARRHAAANAVSSDPNYLSTSEIPQIHPLDIVEYKNQGLQEGVFRKLRLGKYAIDARLDLHNMTLEYARVEVFKFIQSCIKYDVRSVLICHGKGERSKTPAKLKSYVVHWLEEMPEVLAFHSAQKQHGGAGAMYVLLKKSDKKKQETRDKYIHKRF